MFSVGIGTKTSTGGEVIEGNDGIKSNGLTVSSVGHKATCKSGNKSCRGVGPIVAVGPRTITLPAGPAARVGDYVDCGCSKGSNVLVGAGDVKIGSDSAAGAMTQHAANAQRTVSPSAATLQSSSTSSTSMMQTTTPRINPNNAYWPPYNPLAKPGEKDLKVEYTQEVVKFAVLSPKEWRAFFDSFDKAKTFKDTATGLYDARQTAKALGGLGVIAFVKTIEGVDYVILKNYDRWSQTLLHGGVFRADNAQVIKLGLGALNSASSMVKYVRVTAPMEILVGTAINVLQFIVNDEYTLRELGVDEAKLFVHAVVVAGTSLIIGSALAPFIPMTFVISSSILIFSSAAVWITDQATNFEAQLVEAVLNAFNNE